MPELPDLNVFSRNLTKLLSGKKVEVVEIYYQAKTDASPADIKKYLEGATLTEVKREGKELRFVFDNDTVLGLHLMLHGKLEVSDEVKPVKKTIAALIFDDKTSLVISDFMRQAKLSLNPAVLKFRMHYQKK